MARKKPPVTPAIRFLRDNKVDFQEISYPYVDKGGTAYGARILGLDEHLLIKTLIMEDNNKQALIVLMHGDREVSTKALARAIDVKTVAPCAPAVADKHSGYKIGGTSPFATRRAMAIYMEAGIAGLDRIYINGGRRGLLLGMAVADAIAVLRPTLVSVAKAV